MSEPKPVYLTTAIDYVNSRPHIGTAYEKIGADVVARMARLLGVPVRFQMGNDEHSINVVKAAKQQNMDPLQYCDQMEKKFREVWARLSIEYDDFVRTTSARHAVGVKALFERINERKAPDGSANIYRGTYNGWYCDSCEAYYTEKDLLDRQRCPVHTTRAREVQEENYFFSLSKYQALLLDHIKTNPRFIRPAIRRNEIVKLIESGLQDLSISRAGSSWGVPLPIDQQHTVYVWFDALINYLSGLGFGESPAEDFERWWNSARVIHIVGKDITRFHCVIWPAMLIAAGCKLPESIFGHGFITQRGERMSKSLGNVVNPLDIVDHYGADPLRYYLLRGNSFGRDADFTFDNFIERYNSDLANGIGNLVSRTMGMIAQYLDGRVTVPDPAQVKCSGIKQLREVVGGAADKVCLAMDLQHDDIMFHEALAAIWEVIGAVDIFINENKPWILYKSREIAIISQALGSVMASLRVVITLLNPFMPTTAMKAWSQLGFSESYGELAQQRIQDLDESHCFIPPAHEICLGRSVALFPRIENVESKIRSNENPGRNRDMTTENIPTVTPVDAPNKTDAQEGVISTIGIKDFSKVELRVATITAVEGIEGADRLLRLPVDLGNESRQLVAGIAQHYKPDDLLGRQICVVANLKPAKLRGVVSQGMLLAASDDDTVSLLSPLRPVANGSRVK